MKLANLCLAFLASVPATVAFAPSSSVQINNGARFPSAPLFMSDVSFVVLSSAEVWNVLGTH